MRSCILIVFSLLLASCGTEPGDDAKVETRRFVATYQGAFRCGETDREYHRAIYVITDKQTGLSYLAVQGCGTSQLVTEHHGKTSSTVER